MSVKAIFDMLNTGVYRDYFNTNGRKDTNERPIYAGVGKNRREAKKKRNKKR